MKALYCRNIPIELTELKKANKRRKLVRSPGYAN
jgi:hypothetical protein